ncbi:hypothetical protein JCM17960_33920 [Magnetospira thiophila]
MKRPQRFLTRMILFLAVVCGGCFVLFPPLKQAFLANAPLNGLILGVLLLGVIYNFRQVLLLYPEVRWIENFRREDMVLSEARQPTLLAPMAAMMGERRGHALSLSTLSTRTLLDGISSRLDESRDISRYMTGLLIFLGLLGTFWGLLETISAIADVIGSLPEDVANMAAVFGELKAGLEAPLSGMGTAFSSSLFGLSGSLVLGFLDLQASQAQNRFYNDLEEWLSGLTRLSSGVLGEGTGDHSVPAYVQALLEQTAESLENLQHTLARGEENRIDTFAGINSLVERVSILTDQMRTEQHLLKKLSETQIEMRPILDKLADATIGSGGLDETSRGHLRNLDVYAARIMEEMSSGRDDTVRQLRSEIKLLARTIAALGQGGDQN